jgi:hypothetical protein
MIGAAGATMAAGRAEASDNPDTVIAAPVPPDRLHYPSLDSRVDGYTVWTSRDGTRTPLRDLDDGHLLNIERMLRGKGLTRVDAGSAAARQWRPIIYEEVVRRGLTPMYPYHFEWDAAGWATANEAETQ